MVGTNTMIHDSDASRLSFLIREYNLCEKKKVQISFYLGTAVRSEINRGVYMISKTTA